MDLKFFLEELLQCRVDLVTEAALRPQIKSAIEKELIRVT
jgi:predicted nucleotidyltransferase